MREIGCTKKKMKKNEKKIIKFTENSHKRNEKSLNSQEIHEIDSTHCNIVISQVGLTEKFRFFSKIVTVFLTTFPHYARKMRKKYDFSFTKEIKKVLIY